MADHRQRALLQLVREVSRRQIAPRANDHTPGAPFPAEVFALLAELDLLGLPFPVDAGGLEQPTTVVCRVLSELSQAFLAVGLGIRVHLLTTGIVATHARSTVRDDVLPQLIAGEWLAVHGLDLRGGDRVAGLRLSRERDGYVVNGLVGDVTHAGLADCYVVVGRLSDEPTDGGTMLLVTADSFGLRTGPAPDGNLHGTGTLRCNDVLVPVAHRLGAEGRAADVIADLADEADIGVAACAVGLARAALQASVTCARDHVRTAGAPRDAGPAVTVIADIAAAVEAADALCERAAVALDAGRPTNGVPAMARMVATDTAIDVARRAADVHHGVACTAATTLARYRLEAETLRGVEGGDDDARRRLGREIVGDAQDDGR